jgi:hypothetical protein
VQVAHEAGFELTPAMFEVAALPQLKPRLETTVKPSPNALAAVHETKVA